MRIAWSILTMAEPHNAAAGHFDAAHAGDYEKSSRITVAGYDVCHELAACMLVGAISSGKAKRILIVGAGGTAQEIINIAKLEPDWSFVGVDPSRPMLDAAKERLHSVGAPLAAPRPMAMPSDNPSPRPSPSRGEGEKIEPTPLSGRTDLRLGTVFDLPIDERFDGAMMIGVLHHIEGADAKAATLKAISGRLNPGGALVIGESFHSYADQPLMVKAMREHWRMTGDSREEADQRLSKLNEHPLPSDSEETLYASLSGAGFDQPLRFFTSLFWGAWIAQKK
jgi:tRNA (cmo5U34)-methyltransferase